MNFTLLFTLIISAVLRFYNNTAVALWHDEAFSALYIKYSWGEMIHRIILDVHPPLYYFLLRIWNYVFGWGLFSLRSFSIIFGVLTVWAGYKLVYYSLKDKRLALLAALLLAINPFQIQYSLEARMYTLGTFLALYSSYVLAKALENNKTKNWIWYGILVSACMYTHYYLIFTVIAQVLYVAHYIIKNRLINFQKQGILLKAVLSYILSIILYLPWIKPLLIQITRVQQSYWIPPMDKWAIPGTIWKMTFGGQGINHTTLIISTLVTLFILLYYVFKTSGIAKWHIFYGLTIPFVGALLLSLKTAIYLDRYFVFASLYLAILLSITMQNIGAKKLKTLLVILLVFASLFAFFKNWKDLDVKNLFFERSENRKPGIAAAAEYLNSTATNKDKIVVGSSFIFFTFKYYNHTGVAPLLYSTGSLETIPHFSGTAILTNNDLILNYDNFEKNQIIWLLWTTGFGGNKPNVPGNWTLISDRSFADTPGFKGEIFVTSYQIK